MAVIDCFGSDALTKYTYWELPLPAIYNDFLGGGEWFTIVHDSVYIDIWILGILLSLTFIALAKEKDEDEMIRKIRLESMAWALWMTVILFALETLLIFGFAYITTTFLTLFIYLIIFIAKFNYEMFKLKRD